MPDRLAIYRLRSAESRVAGMAGLGQRIFSINGDFQLARRGNSRILRNGQHVVEVADNSGGVWAANEGQLWKPGAAAQLPSQGEAVRTAERVMADQQLLPKLAAPFRLGKPTIGGTKTARKAVKTGQREDRRLDYQFSYPVFVGELPVVGGGGSFKATVGHQGRVTGYTGVWREPGESFEAKVIDRAKTDEQYRALTAGLKMTSFDARLAYYSAPSFQKQEFLYPVYVYGGTALIANQRVPLRQVMLPATEFGPVVPAAVPLPKRKRIVRPRIEIPGDDGKGAGRRNYGERAVPWEAGTEWIGQSGGLGGGQANAQGFVDEWASAGWKIDFNWGDGNAWESDWTSDDDNWVDNVDFLFYTGHASMNGWMLAPVGGDGWLGSPEPGTNPQSPGDLWGQSDLEWMVIAACGPLQDEVISPGGGDVFARWSGAFDGMHILLGYGAITYDNTDEGRKLAQYCKGGSTVIDSWFRAAREIQPSNNGCPAPDGPAIWVGAMWVGQDGIDPGGDHAWDCGSVSGDPHNPSWYAAMWTTC